MDLLVVASPLGQRPETQPPPARGLATLRLAYYDLPTFTLLQSVSSGLVETGDPMANIGDLDEDGFHSLCMAQESSSAPFFEVCHGGSLTLPGTPPALTSFMLWAAIREMS